MSFVVVVEEAVHFAHLPGQLLEHASPTVELVGAIDLGLRIAGQVGPVAHPAHIRQAGGRLQRRLHGPLPRDPGPVRERPRDPGGTQKIADFRGQPALVPEFNREAEPRRQALQESLQGQALFRPEVGRQLNQDDAQLLLQ